MFDNRKRIISALAAMTLISAPAWADVILPAPKTSAGMGVFAALNSRHSAKAGEFPLKDISKQELSSLLWAASGKNRFGKGWTVPFAMGKAPYNTIYVLDNSGVFKYNWKDNRLIEISKQDVREKAGPQPIVGLSPVVLVFVADSGTKPDVAWIASGAMTQNIYLAAESLAIEGRYIISIDEAQLRQALKLKPDEKPLNLMLIGKK